MEKLSNNPATYSSLFQGRSNLSFFRPKNQVAASTQQTSSVPPPSTTTAPPATVKSGTGQRRAAPPPPVVDDVIPIQPDNLQETVAHMAAANQANIDRTLGSYSAPVIPAVSGGNSTLTGQRD